MTALVLPDLDLYDSWADTVRDFGSPTHIPGSGGWEVPEEDRGLTTREACARLVEALRRAGDASVPREDAMVHATQFWITDDGGEVVGFLSLRHELNDFLLEQGGHIGYSVRPSCRRRGHASAALRLALGEAAARGLDRVLVTCDDDNEGSRRTIEGAGGVLEDVREDKRRYWIDVR